MLRPPDLNSRWATVASFVGRLDLVLGLRCAVAFTGPYFVGYMFGWESEGPIVGLAAVFVTMTGARLSRRDVLRHGPGLACVFPVVVLIELAIPPPSLGYVAVLAAAGVVAGTSLAFSRPVRAYGGLFGLGVIFLPVVPADAQVVGLVALGGLLGVSILAVTTRPAGVPSGPSDAIGRALSALADLLEAGAGRRPIQAVHILERNAEQLASEAIALAGRRGPGGRLAAAVGDAIDSVLLLDATVQVAADQGDADGWRPLLAAMGQVGHCCREASARVGAGRPPEFAGLPSVPHDSALGDVELDRAIRTYQAVVGHLVKWNTSEHDHAMAEAGGKTRRRATVPPLVRRHTARLVTALVVVGTAVWAVGDGNEFTHHARWMVVGLWMVLQPGSGPTVKKSTQRAVGTLIGAAATLAIAPLLDSPPWTGLVLFAIAFVCFSLVAVNYAAYVIFLTPIAVVGFEGTNDDLVIVLARVCFTAAGCVVAVIVSRTLWRGAYKEPLTDYLVVETAVAERTLLIALVAECSSSSPALPRFRSAEMRAWDMLADLRLCLSGVILDVPAPASAGTGQIALHSLMGLHHLALVVTENLAPLPDSQRGELHTVLAQADQRLADVVGDRGGSAGRSPSSAFQPRLDALVDLAWLIPDVEHVRSDLAPS